MVPTTCKQGKARSKAIFYGNDSRVNNIFRENVNPLRMPSITKIGQNSKWSRLRRGR